MSWVDMWRTHCRLDCCGVGPVVDCVSNANVVVVEDHAKYANKMKIDLTKTKVMLFNFTHRYQFRSRL